MVVLAVILVVGALGALTLGAVVVRRGWRARDADPTPHCRVCDYSLTGAVSDRCPECGAPRSEKNAVRGNRRVNRGQVAGGVVVIALLALPLAWRGFHTLRAINWQAFVRTRTLVARLADPNPAIAGTAAEELQRRVSAGTVADADVAPLADACLREWTAPAPRPATEFCAGHILGDLVLSGRLTGDRANRFMESMTVPLGVEAPELTALGDPLVLRVAKSRRWEHQPGSALWQFTTLRVGNSEVGPDGFEQIMLPDREAELIVFRQTADLPVAVAPITLCARCWYSPPASPGPRLHEWTTILTATTAFVRELPAGYFDFDRSAQLERSGGSAFAIHEAELEEFRTYEDAWDLTVSLDIGVLPLPAAFEVIAVVDDTAYRCTDSPEWVGTVLLWRANARPHRVWYRAYLPPHKPSHVRFVLLPTERAAKFGVDRKLWGFAVVFDDPPLIHLKADDREFTIPGYAPPKLVDPSEVHLPGVDKPATRGGN